VGYRHQVLRGDLAAGEDAAVTPPVVTPIPVPRAVELLRVPATPQPLDAVLLALAELELEHVPAERQPYLEVRVLLDAPEPGLRARIEQVLADKPVRLAKIEPTRKAAPDAPTAPALSLDQLAQLQPDDIFKRLYAQRYGDEAPEDQLAAFAELMRPGA
jgi:exonuclease SbcD